MSNFKTIELHNLITSELDNFKNLITNQLEN